MHRQKPYRPTYPGNAPIVPLAGNEQSLPPAGSVPFYNPNNFAPPPVTNGTWPGPSPPKEPPNWGAPAQTGPADPWDWGEEPNSQQYTQPLGNTHVQHYNPLPVQYDYGNPPQVYQTQPYHVAPSSQYGQEAAPASHDPWSWGEDKEPDQNSGYYQQPVAQPPAPEPVPQSERFVNEEAMVSDAARDLSSLSLHDIPLVPDPTPSQEAVPQAVHAEEIGGYPEQSWASYSQQAIEEPVESIVLGERSTSVDGAATPVSSTYPAPQHLVKGQSEDRSSGTSRVSPQREFPELHEQVEVTNPIRESTLEGIDSTATPPQLNVIEQQQHRPPVDPPIPMPTERSGFYIGSAPSIPLPGPALAPPPAASPRPQPPPPVLLERDNERPDGEGRDEQPAPLNPIFSQPLGPVTSRPASRQAAPHPIVDAYPQQQGPPVDLHSPSLGTGAARTHPAMGSYHHGGPSSTGSGPLPVIPSPSSLPRQAQEAVGSEFGPPPTAAAVPPTRPPPMAEPLSSHSLSSLPPSSLRMIPGSQTVPQAPPQQSGRPTPAATPVGEQRIVTGYAKNDHPPPAVAPLPQPVPQIPQQMVPADDPRPAPRYAAPPPHRSETIGSENPGVGGGNPTSQMPVSSTSVPERLDDRPANERERDSERTRDRDRDRDYERNRRTSRYHDDDEDERYSTGYRDRRYDDRDYDDERSNYSERVRDRRRDPRRSDYHGESEYMERSGRRSSLFDPELDEYGRAYPSSRDRDPRRRDYPERSRRDDDRYYSQRERSRHGSTSGADPADRDYRGRDPRYDYRPDPRDPYYRAGGGGGAGYDYYQRNPYDAYRGGYPFDYSYYYKYNYAAFYEEMKKNPAAYQEWYQRHYGQHHRYPAAAVVPPTASASEADRASVHSGRSSVNDEVLKERQAAAQLRSSTTGLEQSGLYDWNASVSVFQEETVAQVEETVAPTLQDLTPLKFTSAHVIGRFSAGSLLRVLPNDPKEGAPAYIEIHDLDTLLGDLPSAQELRNFPGPLVAGQTHKQNVIAFCQQKIRKAVENTQMFDRQSYLLIWELLLLLLRQNGTVLGSDISELLLKDIDLHQDTVVQNEGSDPAAEVSVDRALVSFSSEASVINKFRELLLFGNKKEALEWAMRQGLWGHALFLASKMDQRIYSNVMTRFANGLSLTDPLQTLYQLMSGRQPTSVTSCGDEKWGDWRPHLAMIMSNTTQKPDLDKRSIVAMGDQLASKGYFLAAQFCYLVAQVDFGTYNSRTSKLVLLTSSAALPFDTFASSEAIQCTEVYEYARQLATPEFVIPNLQSFKFLYATRLADQGRPAEALQYCEAISRTVLKQPGLYSSGLLTQVYELSSMLKYHDPQYQNAEGPVEELEWLRSLEEALNQKPSAAAAPPPSGGGAAAATATGFNEEPQWVQQQGEQQQQQQYYEQDQQQQQQYYEQQPSSLAPAAAETVETTPSMDYSQDYSNYWAQYNAQYDQYNQQQQQQWNYDASTNGGADYSAQEGYNNYNQGYSKGKTRVVRFEKAPEEEDDEVDEEIMVHNKRVVLRGTYPIDRPLGAVNSFSMAQRPTQLTIKRPKTFDIDQPIGPRKFGGQEDQYNQSQDSYTPQEPSSLDNTTTSQPAKGEGKPSGKDSKGKQAPGAPAGGGWFGGLFNKFSLKPKNQMKLPDDKNPPIVWDPEKKRWVNTQGDEDESAGPAAPPKDSELHGKPPAAPLAPAPTPTAAAAPSSTPSPMNLAPGSSSSSSAAAPGPAPPPSSSAGNKYKLPKGRGIRQSYVDVFGGSSKTSPGNSPPMPELYPSVPPPTAAPAQFFVPPPVAPGSGDPSAPADFVTPAGPQPGNNGPAPEAAEATPLMFNPSQFAAPAANSGRGFAGGRRYPR